MRNQTKIKQLLIARLEEIISKQGSITLTAENVKSIIGGAINRCYESDRIENPPGCADLTGSVADIVNANITKNQ